MERMKAEATGDDSVYFPTRTSDKLTLVQSAEIHQLQDVLMRILQLEDVEDLYKKKKYKDLVHILQSTFTAPNGSSTGQNKRVPVDRPTQLRMLVEGLSHLEDYDQFVIWAEQCVNEAITQYLAAFNRKTEEGGNPSADDAFLASWSKIAELILSEMEEIFRFKRSNLQVLSHAAMIRLAENLVLVCAHQLEVAETNASKMPLNSPVPWVLLHRAIETEEVRQSHSKKTKTKAVDEEEVEEVEDEEEEEEEDSLPCSILFLISSHELLGKRSWCMHKDGIFTIYLLEVSTH